MSSGVAPRECIEPSREAIETELTDILNSQAFRDSPRSQSFLSFVVTAVLDGRSEEIKERTIGVEVFGRPLNYDSSVDSIVRVSAREVRKRLALYNEQHQPGVRIELMAGSYRPTWRMQTDLSHSTSALNIVSVPVGGRSDVRWATGVVVCTAALIGWYLFPASAFQRFWAPVLDDPGRVLICLGHPTVYHLSTRVHDLYRSQHAGALPIGPYEIRLNPAQITGEDVIPASNHYVGTGDALAAAELSSSLRTMGKLSSIRLGSHVSFPELRSGPAILFGGRSNRWTLGMTSELRFAFDTRTSPTAIIDRQNPAIRWEMPGSVENLKVDYAIVSRVFDSTSGNLIISAAGLTHFGTQAAGEMLARPELLEVALKTCPPGWEKRNLQFVISTAIIASAPAPPRVLATHLWDTRAREVKIEPLPENVSKLVSR